MVTDKSDDKRSRSYDVGYGKPPVHTRFQKGQSGNPAGRKPREKNFAALVETELNRLITVRDGDIEKKITKREALVTRLVNEAISGKSAARPLLLKMMDIKPQPGQFVTNDDDEALLLQLLSSARSIEGLEFQASETYDEEHRR